MPDLPSMNGHVERDNLKEEQRVSLNNTRETGGIARFFD
jgi:hypothetical protein